MKYVNNTQHNLAVQNNKYTWVNLNQTQIWKTKEAQGLPPMLFPKTCANVLLYDAVLSIL